MRFRPSRVLAALIALGLLLGVGGGVYAAFSSTTQNTGNTFSAASDLTAPTASASVIQKTEGGTVGFIRQGGTYRVYANVSDAGSPPSGVATVRTDVSNITAGQTAANLAGGSWTIGGVTYGYRSGALTADGPLPEGSITYSLTMTDNASNSRTQGGFTVVVDNTAPQGSDIQTSNGAATAGQAETGDTITYTYSENVEPGSILAGWNGTATAVTVRIVNTANNDTLQIRNAANTALLPLGDVSLRRSYVAATVNFTGSTMVQSGTSITVTLGAPDGPTLLVNQARDMWWFPDAGAFDRAGNPASTARTTESGANDVEF